CLSGLNFLRLIEQIECKDKPFFKGEKWL
ncbi:MAG: hypothetical protein RL253_76, partial [Bacteroidota bacterium]